MIEFRTKDLLEIGDYVLQEEDKFKEIYEAIQARGWFNDPSQFFYTEEGEELFEFLAYELDDLWTGGEGWITTDDVIRVYRYGLILESYGYFESKVFKEAYQDFITGYLEWTAEQSEKAYREYAEHITSEREMYHFRSV